MADKRERDRRPTRLPCYDYSLPGHYFVTICTADKQKTLSAIIVGEGLAPPEVRLSKIGKIAEEQILKISERFPLVTVEKHVIMPNHLHLLIRIDSEDIRYEEDSMGGASPSPTLSDIICSLKSLTTKISKEKGLCNKTLWQRSFHDHIIRNEKDYMVRWDYIENNPALWLMGKDEI